MDKYYSSNFNDLTSIFFIILSIVIISVVIMGIKGIRRIINNEQQPILYLNSKVVTKRTKVTHQLGCINANGLHMGNSSSTSYFVTFEFENKKRLEFSVIDQEYAMLVEGDYGILKYQGTKYFEFIRE